MAPPVGELGGLGGVVPVTGREQLRRRHTEERAEALSLGGSYLGVAVLDAPVPVARDPESRGDIELIHALLGPPETKCGGAHFDHEGRLYRQYIQLSTGFCAVNNPPVIAFGDRLYWVSRKKGFQDNSALARQLKMPRPRVQGLLGLLFVPQAKTLERLAIGLDVSIDVLISGVRTTSVPRPSDAGLDELMKGMQGHPPQEGPKRSSGG